MRITQQSNLNNDLFFLQSPSRNRLLGLSFHYSIFLLSEYAFRPIIISLIKKKKKKIFIYPKRNTTKKKIFTKRNDIQIGRVYFHQTTLNPPPQIILPLQKSCHNFISTHSPSLQNPITHRNHPRIRIPRASPDAPVEQQKTIRGRGRPLDEPKESGQRKLFLSEARNT